MQHWKLKIYASFSFSGDQKYNSLHTPHCLGHQVQKVDTKAKFYVILFVMINALIWCNLKKKWLGSFWDNPIYPIGYPHGQDLGFLLKGQKMQFVW